MAGQKPFYIAIGVVVLGGAAFIASRMKSPNISIPANAVITTADTSGFRGYIEGSASAPVEVTEYGDFQCPQCGSFDLVQFPDVKTRLIDAGKIRYRFRDFPLDQIHSHTRVASHAAACADEQKHFWDVKAGLFARQTEWATVTNPMPIFENIVKDAGVDVSSWTSCMKSAKYAGRIQASSIEGGALGVNSTPTFMIGGRLYQTMSADLMAHIVDSMVAAMPAAAPATAAPKVTGGQ